MLPPAEIVSKTVTDFLFHAKPGVTNVQLHVEVSTGFGVPKSEESKRGLIHVAVDLKADNPEDYCIQFAENIEIEFQERPADFHSVLSEYYDRVGVGLISDDLDEALRGIGKPPLNIRNSY